MQKNSFYALIALAVAISTSFIGVPQPPRAKPVLLIIGHDISKAFKNRDEIKEDNIVSAVKAIQEQAMGGKIAFRIIGNGQGVRPDSFLTHRIAELQSCVGKVGTDNIKCQNKYKAQKIESENRAKEFARRCVNEMKRPATNYTDLNEFLQKCAILVKQPQYKDYQIVLFINSDGDHDVLEKGKRNRQLVCPPMPSNVLVLTSGWENKKNCNSINYVQTSEFFEDFPQQIKNK